MGEVHLDHPGDVVWFKGHGPCLVLGPCPHVDCPHDMAGAIAYGPDHEHYVLDQCVVRDGCNGQCRGWFAEWPHGEGPGGITYQPRQYLHVDVPALV